MVFNTPGANANAVKELVLCAMLMGSRDVDGGIQWVRQQVASGVDVTTVVEKGKAAFIGPELYKKTLGVIGLGAIGSLVANIALSLGMDVYGYDPFLSVDAALRLDRHIHVVKDINELYKRADYITIHIHYTKDTERMIDAKAISAMLDLDTLKASKNQEADVKTALEQLKTEHGYLFEDSQTPPPYAAGTGTHPMSGKYPPEEAAIRAAAGLKTE